MDDELRRAQRLFQRVAGSNEAGLLDLYYTQVRDYLATHRLPLWYAGCSHNVNNLELSKLRGISIGFGQIMATRHVDAFHYSDLDTKTPEEIVATLARYTSWHDWFTLTSYYSTFVAKNPTSYIWSETFFERSDARATADEKMTKKFSSHFQEGEYGYRLQQSFDKWKNYSIICLLSPKYLPHTGLDLRPAEPDLYYNWRATISLYGYELDLLH